MALAERLCRTEQAAVERLEIFEPAKAGATRGAHHLVALDTKMLEDQTRHADGHGAFPGSSSHIAFEEVVLERHSPCQEIKGSCIRAAPRDHDGDAVFLLHREAPKFT